MPLIQKKHLRAVLAKVRSTTAAFKVEDFQDFSRQSANAHILKAHGLPTFLIDETPETISIFSCQRSGSSSRRSSAGSRSSLCKKARAFSNAVESVMCSSAGSHRNESTIETVRRVVKSATGSTLDSRFVPSWSFGSSRS